MKRFRNLYDSTDEMLLSVESIVDYIKNTEQLQGGGPRSQQLGESPSGTKLGLPTMARTLCPGNRWVETLLNNPQMFLRILMTVDIALTCGHLPSEADFPQSLRTSQKQTVKSDIPVLTETEDNAWWLLFQEIVEVGLGS